MDPVKILICGSYSETINTAEGMRLHGTFNTIVTAKVDWSTILLVRFRRKGRRHVSDQIKKEKKRGRKPSKTNYVPTLRAVIDGQRFGLGMQQKNKNRATLISFSVHLSISLLPPTPHPRMPFLFFLGPETLGWVSPLCSDSATWCQATLL